MCGDDARLVESGVCRHVGEISAVMDDLDHDVGDGWRFDGVGRFRMQLLDALADTEELATAFDLDQQGA